MNGSLLAFALLLAAPQSPFQEVLEVRLHDIDVVVQERNGQPVPGLSVDDFELLEDGVPQTITNFSAFVETAASSEAATPGSAAIPPPRTYVFFIDQMALQVGTIENLEKQLLEVAASMRDQDVAAVVRPADGFSISVDLTSDREALTEQLRAALEHSRISLKLVGFEAEKTAFDRELAFVHQDAEVIWIANRYALAARRRARQRLGALRSVVASIAARPGRKIVVAVTQSMPSQPGREFIDRAMNIIRTGTLGTPRPEHIDFLSSGRQQFRDEGRWKESADPNRNKSVESRFDYVDLQPAYDEVARLASSTGTHLYLVRPDNDLPMRGALASQFGPGSGPGVVDPSFAAMLSQAVANTRAATSQLAAITGGREFRPNDVDRGEAATIVKDLSVYYSLAYRARGGLDRVHRIEVRVRNRPDLRVLARSEVERKTAPRELTDRVAAALVGGETENDLRIVLGFGKDPGGSQDRREIEIRIPIASLSFSLENGVLRAHYSAHYAVLGSKDQLVTGADVEQSIEIPESEWERAKNSYWAHVVPVVGRLREFRIAVGVMDTASQRVGIVTGHHRQPNQIRK